MRWPVGVGVGRGGRGAAGEEDEGGEEGDGQAMGHGREASAARLTALWRRYPRAGRVPRSAADLRGGRADQALRVRDGVAKRDRASHLN